MTFEENLATYLHEIGLDLFRRKLYDPLPEITGILSQIKSREWGNMAVSDKSKALIKIQEIISSRTISIFLGTDYQNLKLLSDLINKRLQGNP